MRRRKAELTVHAGITLDQTHRDKGVVQKEFIFLRMKDNSGS